VPVWLTLLGAAGATYVLTHGRIAALLRRVYPPLLCCPMCAGFWVGLVFGVAQCMSGAALGRYEAALAVVSMGFATSLVASAFSIILVTVGGFAKSHGYPPGDACDKLIARIRREHEQPDDSL
jgi:hypothetical protein